MPGRLKAYLWVLYRTNPNPNADYADLADLFIENIRLIHAIREIRDKKRVQGDLYGSKSLGNRLLPACVGW
jgi:hypothetical protein